MPSLSKCTPELRERADRLATVEREELTTLRRANEILKAASVCVAREFDQPPPR